MDVNGDLMNGTRYEQMDSLPIEKRKKSLAYSKSMNALAGYLMANETAEALERWSNGQGSFEQGYTEVLRKNNLLNAAKDI